MRHIDPFISGYDTEASIGNLNIDSETVIGELCNEAVIGFSFDVKGVTEAAKSAASKNIKPKSSAGDNVIADIRKVTRNPLTHVAIGAVAATAPPFGTVVAGLAEAGIAIAEGIMAVAGPVIGFIDDLFSSGARKEQKRKQRVNKARGEEWKERANTAAKMIADVTKRAKAGDKEAQDALVALEIFSNKAIQDSLDTLKEMRDGLSKHEIALKKSGISTNSKLSRMLSGGFNAKRMFGGVALNVLENNPEQKKQWEQRQIIKGMTKPGQGKLDKNKEYVKGKQNARKNWEYIIKEAKKFEKTLPTPKIPENKKRPMFNPKKVASIVKKAASNLEKQVKNIDNGLPGVYVSPKGSKEKGRFIKSSKGGRGWVVTEKGRVVSGRWSRAKK
jgi:hypothetical protein